jgi:hypothetical protein
LTRSSLIDLYDKNLNPVWITSINAVDDFENQVRLHLQKKGKEFPFFAGEILTNNGWSEYFVNCLANFTLTTVFISGNNGVVTGRLYAYQTGGAISSAMNVNDSCFSIARYHSGENYIYPLVVLDRNIIQNTKDFNDIPLNQLNSDAKTNIINYILNDKKYILYASTTKNNQILLLFFDTETGNQIYSCTLGYGNPVEVVQIIQTKDYGLAILGKTWINQRYQRIILYKLSADQLKLE